MSLATRHASALPSPVLVVFYMHRAGGSFTCDGRVCGRLDFCGRVMKFRSLILLLVSIHILTLTMVVN